MPDLAPFLAPSRRGVGYILISCVCFSLMAVGVGWIHQLQPELTTVMTSTLRAGINLICLLLLSYQQPLALLGDRRPALWLRGLFGAVSLLTYFGALGRVGVGEAAFLVQTSSVWVALLAPLWLGEVTSSRIWVAVLGSLAGAWLLSTSAAQTGTDPDTGRALGLLCGFVSSMAYLSVSRASRSNSPETIVFYFTATATLLGIVLLAFQPLVWPADYRIWLLFVGVGVLATVAQIYMTRAYQVGPAAQIAAVAQVGPVLTTLLGWGVLHQLPDGRGWVGMILILLCSLLLPLLKSPVREV